MKSVLPELRLSPRDRRCRARCSFDAAAALFSADFTLEGPEPAPRMVQQLERQIGIRERSARLVLGELDITFTPPGQLIGMDMRSTPQQWRPERLQVPTHAPALWFEPAVDLDENDLCVVDTEIGTWWDPEPQALLLRFTGEAPVRWFALADHVFASIDAATRLCGLMFTRVSDIHGQTGHTSR